MFALNHALGLVYGAWYCDSGYCIVLAYCICPSNMCGQAMYMYVYMYVMSL